MNFRSTPLVAAISLLSAGQVLADGQIAGRVSTTSEQSLNGMTVKLERTGQQVLTQDGGRFRFNQVAPGVYSLILSQGGRVIATEEVSVVDDEVTRVRMELDESSSADDEILVIGQAAQLQRALDRERFADNSISAVDADAIGQLPDANAAEALQRVPGLSIERDQGEGRFVRIRGIGAELNAVTVNGTQVPAPEAGSRAVALDVIPAALLSSLTVTKTLTPDMDANAIGGAVDIRSISALDHDEGFISADAEAAYDKQSEQTNPSLSVSGGKAFELSQDQRLGVALALSWENRDFGSDNVETGGAWDLEESPALLEEVEMREYSINRQRSGAALNLEYEINRDHKLWLNNLYSRFADDEQRQAIVVEFEDAISSGETGSGDVARELKDRKETQTIMSSTFGGKHVTDDWTITYQIGVSKAEEDEPDSIAGAVFEGTDSLNDLSFSSSRRPVVSGPAAFYDTDGFELAEIEAGRSHTQDIQRQAQLDISRDFLLGEKFATLKAGAKTSRRHKSQDADVWVYEDFGDAPLSLSDYRGATRDYSLGRFGPGIHAGAIRNLMAGLNSDEAFDEEESALADYRIQENISATYLMGTVDITHQLHMIAGVRHEKTETDLAGNALNSDDELIRTERENDYSHTLPALLTRWDLNNNTEVRAAWTHAVVRPTFEQMSPNFVDDGAEAEMGNPDLKPLESANLDLSVAHYLGDASVLSAALFHKSIDHFVYETDIAGSADYSDYDEVITFRNGDNARLSGIELAIAHRFSHLPAPFNGLLINANATFTESDATISGYIDGEVAERDIPLPDQSDVSGNFIVGYENERFSIRLATNYKSEYLAEVNSLETSDADVWQSSQTQVDFNAAYQADKDLKITFGIANLTDESYYSYQKTGRYNAQYEDYGPTYSLGIRYTNF